MTESAKGIMYTRSASFYDTIYHFVDYAGAVRQLHQLIQKRAPRARTLLDVACGSGQHVQHFLDSYEVEGLDLSDELLEVARQRCPEVPFHHADMSDFRLPRRFDVVTCLFSSIGYTQTLEKMREAVACMAEHLNPGGLLLVEPWFEPETYWTDTITANHAEGPDLRICWMYASQRVDNVSIMDIHYLVGTPNGVEHFVEEHRGGLFTRDQITAAIGDAGLEVDFDPKGPFGRGLYIAQAPAG